MMVCSSIPKSMKCWFLISWAFIVYRTQAANLSGFHSFVYRFPDGGGHWVISTRESLFLLMVSILCYFHHTFGDDIGKAVIVYWTGATLVVGIPPVIPATGAVSNITTTAAVCLSPGSWTPMGPLNPIDDSMNFLNRLAGSMQSHLPTTTHMYNTVSIYPGAPPPVAPGVLISPGYTVP